MESGRRFRIAFSAFIIAFSSVFLFSVFTSNAETFYQKTKNGVIHITNIPPKETGYRAIKTPWQTVGVSRHRSGRSFKYSKNFDHHINERASHSGIDPRLLKAIIKVESNFNPKAVSPKGAMGLMQLMPETARRNGVSDPYDPVENIRGGVKYFKKLTRMFNGDLRLALAGYNAGEEAVIEYGYRIPPYRETIDYVDKVLAHYDYLKNGGGGRGVNSTDVSMIEHGDDSSKKKNGDIRGVNGTETEKKSHLSDSEEIWFAKEDRGITNKGQIALKSSNDVCVPALIQFQPIPEFSISKEVEHAMQSTINQACILSTY